MTELRPHELYPAYEVAGLLGRGVRADITTCDREPIHQSGAIQPHGVLLAVREADLTVRLVSANTAQHLGIPHSSLLGAPLADALGPEPVGRLREALVDPRLSGADPLTLHLPSGACYELTWHRTDQLVVAELEPAAIAGAVTGPLLSDCVRHATHAMHEASGMSALCDAAAAEFKHLTGYDRVMVYRFHPDEHGEVVAERCEPEQEPFLGLHYPASDIPRQARKLYLLNHLRVIADVDYEPVPLSRAPDMGDYELNLSLSGLRSVSPMHLAYLRNMGVQATLTVSLIRGTRLWGMLACHHRIPKRIDAQLRAACRVLGQTLSAQIGARESQDRNAYRSRLAEVQVELGARMSGAESLAEALATAQSLALRLTAADGMVARIDGHTVAVGVLPPTQAVEALLERLCSTDEPSALVCDDLPHRFAELEQCGEHASGVLALPLSPVYEDFILWFRGEFAHTLNWAGDPDQPMSGDPTAGPDDQRDVQLGPRHSFDAFAQEVRGRCRPWLAAEIDAARALAAAVPDLLLARARDRLAHFAMHDPLTGLPNRTLLLERVAQALGRQVPGGRQVAMLFIDLDRFRLVNDSVGHAGGDTVLREASRRLNTSTRDTDTVARIGGDEFIVLCEGITRPQADQLAERIVHAFRTPFIVDGLQALVTASIGVAFADADSTPAALPRHADTAMQRAKQSGRNAAAPFTEELRLITLRRLEIETGLRPALERGELCLYFQPIHTTDGALTGFEALTRWPLAGRGMVPPSEFIPVAEAIDLIGPLTDWALDEGLGAWPAGAANAQNSISPSR